MYKVNVNRQVRQVDDSFGDISYLLRSSMRANSRAIGISVGRLGELVLHAAGRRNMTVTRLAAEIGVDKDTLTGILRRDVGGLSRKTILKLLWEVQVAPTTRRPYAPPTIQPAVIHYCDGGWRNE